MVSYLKSHEVYIRSLLEKNEVDTDWKAIGKHHERKIKYFQHERLIHLLVMLTTSLGTLLSFFFTLLLDNPAFFILTFVLLVLSGAYVIHYFQLENGVQRLYKLGDRIAEKKRDYHPILA